MSNHPYKQHAEKHPGRGRVSHILGKKDGGSVASIGKEALNLHKKEHKAIHADQKATGGAATPRMDKYARGGKVKGNKGHHTKINIMVAPKAGGDAGLGGPPMGGPPPGAGAMPPPPMPPKAPMAPPPGGPMAGGMPGMKRGGGVKSGISSPGNLKKWADRASANTRYAKGGAIKMTAGADNGEGRLQKSRKYRAG